MMGSVEERLRTGGGGGGGTNNTLAAEMKMLKEMQDQSGVRKGINSELWHACAGPLVNLPQVGSLVYYFSQGHSEQVAASTRRTAPSQTPNYPNLPSQLLCQVQNVTLHADKDTDEIYAQMSLQPVNSENDIFPVPDFGLKPRKHPSEFFCKTLTASDTSTHGGFSVPRSAAEKLFPPLDYSIQPPTQELLVRDLHDHTWTFRHIYRGQPKRHLLTTGWSLFVGSKRLRAGDAVLFIRNEKSQLLVGIRRANRQQTTLPSSVLSADSMHIGVLAAAAHAAANRSPFAIFYNPRACLSEFVIPLAKYRKAVYGTQLAPGMRFGMMFETEDSSKRRYMGTIVGISDLDPLRWPGSKWRNLQVEWDEPGCGDRQTRVSPWEIETPESLFIFSSLASSLKRPFCSEFSGDNEWGNLMRRPFVHFPENGPIDLPRSIPNLYSEHVFKMLTKPQTVNNLASFSSVTQEESTAKVHSSLEAKIEVINDHKALLESSEINSLPNQNCSQPGDNQSEAEKSNPLPTSDEPGKLQHMTNMDNPACSSSVVDLSKSETEMLQSKLIELTSLEGCNVEKLTTNMVNPQNFVNQLTPLNQNQAPSQLQTTCAWPMQPQLDSTIFQSQFVNVSQSDSANLSGLLATQGNDEGMVYSCQPLAGIFQSTAPSNKFALQEHSVPLPGVVNPTLPLMNPEMWDHQKNLRILSQTDQLTGIYQQAPYGHSCMSSSSNLRDLPNESSSQCGIYGRHKVDISNNGGTIVDPSSVSSTILDDFYTLKDGDFENPSDCLGNLSSSQDVQSQITSASLAESQAFSIQEFPDNSGGTSSSIVDFDESSLLQNSSWQQQVAPRMRTYTKVQKAGSVGRSIDVNNFHNYEELCCAIEHMFGLEGLLNDTRGSGWKLVYVDYENDVLLVGDDPWEEFVGCVRCIRILSPSEVQHMSEEGMKLLNGAALQGINGSM